MSEQWYAVSGEELRKVFYDFYGGALEARVRTFTRHAIALNQLLESVREVEQEIRTECYCDAKEPLCGYCNDANKLRAALAPFGGE